MDERSCIGCGCGCFGTLIVITILFLLLVCGLIIGAIAALANIQTNSIVNIALAGLASVF